MTVVAEVAQRPAPPSVVNPRHPTTVFRTGLAVTRRDPLLRRIGGRWMRPDPPERKHGAPIAYKISRASLTIVNVSPLTSTVLPSRSHDCSSVVGAR